ncbi:potassium-transporting ATPase subunit F [Rossellomorea sp. NPDC071047]|nr:potassium-transporting ATPase subunit F [Rossellomorea vietnamensis]
MMLLLGITAMITLYLFYVLFHPEKF